MNATLRPHDMSDEAWRLYERVAHPDGEEYPGALDGSKRRLMALGWVVIWSGGVPTARRIG